MHRVVSTPLSITLIAISAIFVAAYALTTGHSLTFPADDQIFAMRNLPKKSASDPAICQVHAFQGEAKVSAWKIMKGDKAMVQVAAADVPKLPSKDIDNFELIDTTPELEKKLDSSSEEKPVKIAISGFATKCDGTALACLSYKEGIFRPYLTD